MLGAWIRALQKFLLDDLSSQRFYLRKTVVGDELSWIHRLRIVAAGAYENLLEETR
jgi:hypothetical protein